MVEGRDEQLALLEDKARCDVALACTGETFTDSWDHLAAGEPRKRASRLGYVGAVVQLLDEMARELDAAYATLKRQQHERDQAAKRKVHAIVDGSRVRAGAHEQRVREEVAALEQRAAGKEADGDEDAASILRTQAEILKLGIPMVRDGQAMTESAAGPATALLDIDTIEILLGQLHAARRKGRFTRLRTRWVNPVVIGVVGLLAGVVATQILQDQVADLATVLPWVVAVVAWALLDYLVEPRLRTGLADRQLEQMRREVGLAFQVWSGLRVFEAAPGERHPLPPWSTLSRYTDTLPPLYGSSP